MPNKEYSMVKDFTMKTHIILLELTQNSENIAWLEHVLLSGLNQGESIKLKKLAEINDNLKEITENEKIQN